MLFKGLNYRRRRNESGRIGDDFTASKTGIFWRCFDLLFHFNCKQNSTQRTYTVHGTLILLREFSLTYDQHAVILRLPLFHSLCELWQFFDMNLQRFSQVVQRHFRQVLLSIKRNESKHKANRSKIKWPTRLTNRINSFGDCLSRRQFASIINNEAI